MCTRRISIATATSQWSRRLYRRAWFDTDDGTENVIPTKFSGGSYSGRAVDLNGHGETVLQQYHGYRNRSGIFAEDVIDDNAP